MGATHATRNPIPRLEVWEVKWGETRCTGRAHCDRLAELLYDGQPLCIDCADLLLEHQLALESNPQLMQSLPGVWEWCPELPPHLLPVE